MLEKAANVVLKKCMEVKKGEKVLIITDSKEKKIANIFLKIAPKLKIKISLIEIPIGKIHGEEAPKWAAEEMLKYDVILLITTKSLSHTKARKNACKKGARIASMPTINKETMMRALDIDYEKLKERNKKLMRFLTKGKMVRVITKKGTDLVMNTKGRKCFDDNGIYNKKGSFGNLPAGEICIAPVEGTANGVFIIDESVGGIGKADKNIKIEVKKGFAINIEGGKSAEKLKGLLRSFGKNAYNIAELGIGTNDKAKISGNVLEDEKCLKTVHIAFGTNKSFGGEIESSIHIDCVFSNPSILVDNKEIIKEGKFIF